MNNDFKLDSQKRFSPSATWPPPIAAMAMTCLDAEGVVLVCQAKTLMIDCPWMRWLTAGALLLGAIIFLGVIILLATLLYKFRQPLFHSGDPRDQSLASDTIHCIALVAVMTLVYLWGFVKLRRLGHCVLDQEKQQGLAGGHYAFKFSTIASVMVRYRKFFPLDLYFVYFGFTANDAGRGWRPRLSWFWKKYLWLYSLGLFRRRDHAEAIAHHMAEFIGVDVKHFEGSKQVGLNPAPKNE